MSEDLESLLNTLETEAAPPADELERMWNEPESGAFPPQVYPGRHRFVFKLADKDAFDKLEWQGKSYLQVTFDAMVQLPGKTEPARVGFQRASQVQFGKFNSDLVELLRCLDVKPASLLARDIVAALQQADGRAAGEAVFGWEAYSKDTQEIITTNPRKKPRKSGKTDIAWPKDAQGKYQLVVKFPESGDSVYGRERIVSYKLPSHD